MSNDYGQSKFVTENLIDGIQRKIKASKISEAGGTVSQVADAIMDGVDWTSLAKTMSVVLGVKAVADLLGRQFMDMQAIRGYQLIAQGYVEHPEAVEFAVFTDKSDALTIRDLFNFVLSKEETSNSLEILVACVPGIEYNWFVETILPLPIQKRYLVTPNKEAYALAEKHHQEEMDKLSAQEDILNMSNKEFMEKKKAGE